MFMDERLAASHSASTSPMYSGPRIKCSACGVTSKSAQPSEGSRSPIFWAIESMTSVAVDGGVIPTALALPSRK